jgi:phosphate transport system permease protein
MASRLSPAQLRRMRMRERAVEFVLFLCAASSVAITLAIVGVLFYESLAFLQNVPIGTFLTDTVWTPLFANPRYGILPLLNGTLLSTLVAVCVAGPLGLVAAMYLSEFASPRVREVVKPTLELLSGVPTVV